MKDQFQGLLREHAFLDRSLYRDAERLYSLRDSVVVTAASDSITNEISKIRDQLRSNLESVNVQATGGSLKVSDLVDRLAKVELENKDLRNLIGNLEARLSKIEGGSSKPALAASTAAPAPAKPAAPAKDDDDFDLFEEEEETEEKKRLTEERLKAYAAKKSNKPALIAKSSILLDVKVWDDETDMKALEASVRGIQMDGLVWGVSKLVPVAYNIKKLQIQCVIEDDKVSTEALEEQICAFEDYVQSVDIAAFNRI